MEEPLYPDLLIIQKFYNSTAKEIIKKDVSKLNGLYYSNNAERSESLGGEYPQFFIIFGTFCFLNFTKIIIHPIR